MVKIQSRVLLCAPSKSSPATHSAHPHSPPTHHAFRSLHSTPDTHWHALISHTARHTRQALIPTQHSTPRTPPFPTHPPRLQIPTQHTRHTLGPHTLGTPSIPTHLARLQIPTQHNTALHSTPDTPLGPTHWARPQSPPTWHAFRPRTTPFTRRRTFMSGCAVQQISISATLWRWRSASAAAMEPGPSMPTAQERIRV